MGTESFCGRNDVELVSTICKVLAKRLVVCRGALWFIQKNGTVTVALPNDKAKRDVIQQQLIAELSSYEMALQPSTFQDPQIIHECMKTLYQFSRNVCGQAVVNNDFERLYWEGDPVDNYAKAIRRINKHACSIRASTIWAFCDEAAVSMEFNCNE